jgi:hypothetical protein
MRARNDYGQNSLHLAAMNKGRRLCHYDCNKEEGCVKKRSPLLLEAKEERTATIKSLPECGAKFEAKDLEGRTVLYRAFCNRHKISLRSL